MEQLHPIEVRVLGALLEKDLTTPEYYPLTLNSLQNACNQKSSREPVTNFDESTVQEALDLLQNKGFVTRVSGAGHRVEKFGHRLGEKLNLGRRELALLCVLMLRGAQTTGELRGRTERMHDFADMEEAEHVLNTLASRDEPLVARAPRGRWIQLFSEAAIESVAEPEHPVNAHTAQIAMPTGGRADGLEQRIANLEQELARIKDTVEKLQKFQRQFE